MADTGWLNFTYAEEISRVNGEGTWLDANYALLDNWRRAQNTLTVTVGFTHWLRLYTLDGKVPEYSRVDGIEVLINKIANRPNRLMDSSLRLSTNSTTLVGAEKASSLIWPTGSNNYMIYGSSVDTWNVALTYASINNPNFGVMLSVKSNDIRTSIARVKYVGIKIYYTPGSVPGVINISKINGVLINKMLSS